MRQAHDVAWGIDVAVKRIRLAIRRRFRAVLQDVLAAMGAAPEREWRAIELATLLRLDRSDLTGELIRWAKRKILIEAGPATWTDRRGPPRPPPAPPQHRVVNTVLYFSG
ncbi:hypothetical protein ACFXOD_37785 [Streptomyces sp. NPDC059161]|uniref:hypothetical protein n=1 Tax=Streptomyces sp. NPDC059161 TaxID=3346749 RepID=UPI00369AEE65